MTTTPSRYPHSLSQATSSGPSRPVRGYPAPSIDSSIASPPSSSSSSSVPLNEYSSLADLLQQAGYKETRVFTPEAEKSRSSARINKTKIKKTLDEVEEDEIASLYGTYGFTRSGLDGISNPNSNPNSGSGLMMERMSSEEERMRHQHITEPALPMKSSSSILRSLAIQDKVITSSLPKESNSNPSTNESSWWNGWSKSTSTSTIKPVNTDGYQSTTSSYEASVEVGLGLAKGGSGVRKIKSVTTTAATNWDTSSRPRRAGTDSPPQEERPPPIIRPRIPSSPTELMSSSSAVGFTYTPTKKSPYKTKNIYSSPPPPQPIDEDEYGYSPLPEDYEEQCTDDEAMYAMGLNDNTSVYSLGSTTNSASTSNPSLATSLRDNSSILSSHYEFPERYAGGYETREGSEDRAVREIKAFQDEMALIDEINQVGKRILQNTVGVDELDFDSPESQTSDLPYIEDEYRIGMDNGVPRIPLPNTPISQTYWSTEGQEDDEETQPTPSAVVPQKKTLKYGDRATKLRIAHSTPALRQSAISSSNQPLPEGWLGSIKSALLGKTPSLPVEPQSFTTIQSQPKGPMKISPAIPALPTLITTSPVICDSHSTEAEDLPPLPSSRPILNHTSSISNFLKMRPSLARLKNVVLGPSINQPTKEDDSSLVLSPRLNWDEQGTQFAGWSPNKPFKSSSSVSRSNENGIDALFGPQPDETNTERGEIDYSKSFFYKPFTPPRTNSSSTVTTTSSSSISDAIAEPSTPPKEKEHSMNKKKSIKSLKAALLLPVAPASMRPAQPPVPAIPEHLSHLATPRKMKNHTTPILAIQSPGAWVPRELVLEGEEWDAREGSLGDWGRGRGKRSNGGGKVRRRKSKKIVRD
ncbi:uncharacterized protein IL334_002373 [Kwoniella shivajii]|uniref:Uncharacterized protein n=1 Tax=Kwoniella shivajii TaxID=564305 RepID=A0ABZ1CUX4_9TREE|nr:hypothetical protein IL334_002373 [Kwoniella shivajii]